MTALLVTSAVATVAGATLGAVGAYQQGKAAESAGKAQAKASMQQAQAEAAEQNRQARLENTRAGIAQIGAEQEAEKRSRILAQDIGSMYANFAGNGLMVDGSAKDTVGAALRTEVGEAASDITTIRDNAAMEVWTHRANAASHRANAANSLIAGRNQAAMFRAQGKAAKRSSRWQMGSSIVGGIGQLASLGLTYGNYLGAGAGGAGAGGAGGGDKGLGVPQNYAGAGKSTTGTGTWNTLTDHPLKMRA